MVTVKGLTHRFDTRNVLEDVSLSADRGEIVAIMGSSGGGKTTMLRCIGGLLAPTQGEINVAGLDVIKDPEAARLKMGFVFQYAALFDYMNVADNILFGVRRMKSIKPSEEVAFLAERMAEVGLNGCEQLLPSEISGGMRKRVGLARALSLKPDVLLYDEPASGLDPVTAYAIDQLIVETRDRTGATSIVVSHDVNSVFRVADKVAFLEGGRLVFTGSPQEFVHVDKGSIREIVAKSRAEVLGSL